MLWRLMTAAVCVLQTYQDRLLLPGDIAASVNAHIAKVKFSSDEGHFTFVFVRTHGIEIRRIAPGGDGEEPSTSFACFPAHPRMAVDADAAAVDLACAQIDQFQQPSRQA